MKNKMLFKDRFTAFALTLFLVSMGGLCLSLLLVPDSVVGRAYAASSDDCKLTAGAVSVQTQSVNSRAHAAYKNKLRSLCEDYHQSSIRYRFVDLNRDGVDELVVAWLPEVFTYSKGKVKSVDKAMTGSSYYFIAPKAKVFYRVEPDHCGSATYYYYRWNGKKFAHVATMYTHDKRDKSLRIKSHYWVKGKGSVSKKVAAKYVKKILKGKKAQRVSYKQF